MLLSVSSELSGQDTNLEAVTQGSAVDSGIPQGTLLSRLIELTLDATQDNTAALATVRQQLVDEMNAEALVDASAVIGNFQRMVRVADGTGIPLDKPVSIISAGLREELGFNELGSADLTPKVGALAKWLGVRLRPLFLKKLAQGRTEA